MQSIYSSFIPGEDAFASKMLLPRRGFFAKNTHPMEKRSADGGGKRDKYYCRQQRPATFFTSPLAFRQSTARTAECIMYIILIVIYIIRRRLFLLLINNKRHEVKK